MKKSRKVAWPALAAAAIAAVAYVGVSPSTALAAGPSTSFPSAKGQQTVTKTLQVSGTYDGGMKRLIASGLGDGGSSEHQKPIIEVAGGGVVQNVIIGAPGVDGIHCKGSCTLRNVWWEDVGEDAATMVGTAPGGSVVTIDGGGARNANDKVFQHNGPGSMVIQNFYVNGFGKLYRACGTCSQGYQGKRSVTVRNVIAQGGKTTLVGINSNYGDTANISQITIIGDPQHKFDICQRYTANNKGQEPTRTGSGPGSGCNYSASSITYK